MPFSNDKSEMRREWCQAMRQRQRVAISGAVKHWMSNCCWFLLGAVAAKLFTDLLA